MKLSDLSFFSSQLLQLSCDDLTGQWQKDHVIQIQSNGGYDDEFLIRQGDLIGIATVIGSPYRLALQVQSEKTLWLLRNQSKNSLKVQWLDLVEILQMNLNISVDEAIADDLAKNREIPSVNVPDAVSWLNEHFIALEERNDSQTPFGQVFLGRFENSSNTDFVIFGAGWRGTIKQEEDALKLMSITRLKGATPGLALATGNISFEDASVAVRLRSTEQKALLDAALRDNGSYLRLWQEYGQLEWEEAKDCARKLGSLAFRDIALIESEGGWEWFLKTDLEQLKEFKKRWRFLGLSDTTQVEIGSRELDLDFEEINMTAEQGSIWNRPVRGKLKFKRDGVILEPPQDRRSERPPMKGYIYYSLSGDDTVKNRRERAKKSIDEGRRLPQLRYLLEGMAPPIARMRRKVGLSPYAKACFKGLPTKNQAHAIEVAINTPDIALIVGPPGTGKTQVIAALQRRLTETLDGISLQHQVLISSYQHDAVDNALTRTEVFGLPAVRVGGRDQNDEGGVDLVTVWCDRKQKEVSARLDSLLQKDPLAAPLAELDRRITTLRLAQLSAEERQIQFEQINAILQQLATLNVNLPPRIKDDWYAFFARQSRVESGRAANDSIGILRHIRGLRTTLIGFSDDGNDKVYQLERALRREGVDLQESEWDLLGRLSNSTTVSEEELFELLTFKNAMLDRLTRDYRPPKLKQAMTSDALALLAEIQQAIDMPLSHSRRGIPAVVSSYCNALSQDPEQVKRTVQTYASIVGATCQQSAGKKMTSLKELSDLDASDGIEFDTVVIDEAARANPLDLFVPMAMARRRIVLVGDPMQLPHLVQRELEDELDTRLSLTEAQLKAYKQSLFERLFNQLREQQNVDNIERVVMLDTQYRMHPTLGDFISKQFYERYGLGILHSGRPASDFYHEIPGYQGKCAAWLDVPMSDGKEDRRGTSRIRPVEATVIAREVKRIADNCGSTLSIGVISFYAAQRDLILEEFKSLGLSDEEDGGIVIHRHYRETDSGEERLRVGTVDGFQGKEFDVVFLSIVRANDKLIPNALEDIQREQRLNDKYGHLRLPNRLNVAMSRQRKLLIAVGDKRMAEGDEAEEAVPALAEFLKLCRKEAENGC